jgi:hypothetical protein
MVNNINEATKAFIDAHNILISPGRIGVASFLGLRSVVNQSPQIQTGLNSFLEKIPILGLIPFAKMAQSAMAFSNFAVALNALIKPPGDDGRIFKPTYTGAAIAAGAILNAVKTLFDEHISKACIPDAAKDLATVLWTAGSALSGIEAQAEIERIGTDDTKKERLAYLKNSQQQSVVFVAVGIITLLGKYFEALRSPIIKLALTVAPVAVAIFGATKNVYSESSQLVNPSLTPACLSKV